MESEGRKERLEYQSYDSLTGKIDKFREEEIFIKKNALIEIVNALNRTLKILDNGADKRGEVKGQPIPSTSLILERKN